MATVSRVRGSVKGYFGMVKTKKKLKEKTVSSYTASKVAVETDHADDVKLIPTVKVGRDAGNVKMISVKKSAVELLLAAEQPGADRGAKARAMKALHAEVRARSLEGKDPVNVERGILARVNRLRAGH